MSLVARKTEYKGVVYRSKCEAMFAKWLELHLKTRGAIGSGFVYEPVGMIALAGWTPDFVAFEISNPSEHTLSGLPCLAYTIIEYKPSRPTQTYVIEFAERCKALFEQWEAHGWLDIAYRSSFVLQFGSVFSDERASIHVSGDWGWTPFETATDWLAPYENEVKSTRFDLLAARDAVEQSRLSQIARLKEWEAKRNGR
jgi:hypothetical protein